jgi:copper chaperone CopZ
MIGKTPRVMEACMARSVFLPLIIALILFMSSCAMRDTKAAAEDISTVRIDLVTCACRGKDRLDYTLNRMQGVIRVKMDDQRNEATVVFDRSQTSVDDIEAALLEAGFLVGGVTVI